MVYVSASIACIVARELLEMIMFVCSHFGAVSKSPTIDDATRQSYYKYLSSGIASGILGGLAISLGIGFGLRAVFNSGGGLEAEIGMEAGEAVSKLIGFVFVLKMVRNVLFTFQCVLKSLMIYLTLFKPISDVQNAEVVRHQ